MARQQHRVLLLGMFVTLLTCTNSDQLKTKKEKEVYELIMKSVEKKPPVPPDGGPIILDCELNLDSFDSINEAKMEFSVGIFLYLQWTDTQFIQWIKQGKIEQVMFDYKSIKDLWVPDIYFPNEKKARLHEVFVPNKMIRTHLDGTTSFVARISLTLNCQMKLHNFPFDRQTCSIEIESFSLKEESLLLRWNINNSTHQKAVLIDKGVELPQFTIRDIITRNESHRRRDTGAHSRLVADIILERRINYYLVQMYIPSIFVVLLSWMSFWLNVGAVPGRVSLGVLTVLTMVTQSSGVNASLPRVSYTKAIDFWMSTCLFFVFAALLEFAVANVLSRRDLNRGFKLKDIPILPKLSTKKKKTKSAEVVIGDQGEMKLDPKSDPTLSDSENRTPGHIHAMYLDVTSRFLFPFCFCCFNIFYWTHYLNRD